MNFIIQIITLDIYKLFINNNQMASLASIESEQFDKKVKFVGQRMKTCSYRFYKILQARRVEVPRLNADINNSEVQRQVRQNIIGKVDDYVNCIIKQHRGGQIPQNLQPAVSKFKNLVYTKLSPQYVLQDQRVRLVRLIYDSYIQK